MSPRRWRRRAVLVATLLGWIAVDPMIAKRGWAHGGPIPLETWGAFSPPAAYCQRIIGAAAASCAKQAARLRQQCLDAISRGEECNDASTTAAITAVRRETLDLVDIHCGERDAINIGYRGNFDLQADIINFCRAWEDETASAVYGTVLPITEPLDAPTYACVSASAAAAAKLAELIFDTWRDTLNRIAVRPWNLAAKTSMIDKGSARIAGMERRAADSLAQQCTPALFESVYHRSAATLIHDLAVRANCFAPAFYVQDKLVCPTAVCGNWIIEPGETCDDGNVIAGDGCDQCIGP